VALHVRYDRFQFIGLLFQWYLRDEANLKIVNGAIDALAFQLLL
jgi:hypothetical protein